MMKAVDRGINDGRVYLQSSLDSPLCPFVNFKSSETLCWDMKKLQALPPRGQSRGSPLSLFTILREPIERIGSQAFYSREVVGTKTIVQFIVDRCATNLSAAINIQTAHDLYEKCKRQDIHISIKPTLEICLCIDQAYRLAIEELRSNESLWFQWFELSDSSANDGWFLNFYKKNYFLERLFGGVSALNKAANNESFRSALRGLGKGCSDCNPAVNVVYELSAMTACFLPRRNLHSNPAMTRDTLTLAKQLLRTHIDFIIMEKYGEYSSAGAIASVLGAEQHVIAKISNVSHHGRGKFASTSSYRDIMPQSVVKYLETENALDIEFYHYAVKVFEERAAAEGWDNDN